MLLSMFIVISFFSSIHVCTDIRGVTREALSIRANQFGLFFLREALTAEAVGTASRAITPRLHRSKRLREICSRRHNDSRSSTDNFSDNKTLKLIKNKFSFRSPRVKTVSRWESILSINHYRLALAFCSPQSILLATVEEEQKDVSKTACWKRLGL